MIFLKKSSSHFSAKQINLFLELYKDKVIKKNDYHTKQGGISYSDLFQNSKSFAQALAKDLRDEKYQFGQAEIRKIEIKGKVREIYSFSVIDTIVAAYFSYILDEHCKDMYSENLYSYQTGKNYFQPVLALANYVKGKKQDVYILRRDFRKYTDTIPVHEKSPVWSMLRKDFDFLKDDYIFGQLKKMIRCEVNRFGVSFSNYLGIPTGQPITAFLYNYYAIPMDRFIDSQKDIFYSRYSDDFLVACTNQERAIHLNEQINQLVNKFELSFKDEKHKNFVLNRSGASEVSSADFTSTQYIEFLGCRIDSTGEIGLKPNKVRIVFQHIKQIIKRVNENDISLNDKGRVICDSINRSFFGNTDFSKNKTASLIRNAVTDRSQLKNLDYQIALLISNKLSGVNGPSSFRKIPYEKIRNDWRLKSLERERNR